MPALIRHVLPARRRRPPAIEAVLRPVRVVLAMLVSGAVVVVLVTVVAGIRVLVRDEPPASSRSTLVQVVVDREVERWRELARTTGTPCPSPDGLLELGDDHRDLWGTDVRFLCEALPPYRMHVVSAGVDRAFGTADDIESRAW